MTCRFATLDAAYVLGSLGPAERADYERHLRGCEECARSVRELAGLPGLLARVPADVLEPSRHGEPVPATLLPGLVAAAERQQRRRTTRTALLAAAAVAVIAGGSALVAASLDSDEQPVSSPPAAVETTAPPQQMSTVGGGRSTGWVSLTPSALGTRLDLTCVYRSDYGGGGHAYTYKLVVMTTDGLVDEVEKFKAGSGEEVHVTADTAAAPDAIKSVEVRNSYGDAILRLRP